MGEPIELGLIFSVGELALKLPELFGIVETIDKKIDRLSEAEFEAGYRFIEQIKDSVEEQEFLLKQAWIHLNKAISLEKELRLALSYLGLSFCQYHLSEEELAKASLEEILKVETRRDKIHVAKKVTLGTVAAGLVAATPIVGPPVLALTVLGLLLLAKEKRKYLIERVKYVVNNYIGSPDDEKLAQLQNAVRKLLTNIDPVK
jgi:tetratricopeptide (TPR) repeat protein